MQRAEFIEAFVAGRIETTNSKKKSVKISEIRG